jgi:hypothetical protein
MFLFLLQLPVERDIGRKNVARWLDLACFLTLVGLIVAYATITTLNRPTLTEEVGYQDLLAAGKQLYESECRCANKQIRYGDFVNYTDDSDYQWCLDSMPAEAIFCVTATYQFQAELKGAWDFTSDIILSRESLLGTIKSYIRSLTFNAWNVLSDSILASKNLITAAINSGALSGNQTEFDTVANQVYKKFVDGEIYVKNVTERMVTSMSMDNDRYLQLCEPVGCKVHVKQSIAPMLIAIFSILGGYISLIVLIGNFFLDKSEDKYLESLLEEYVANGYTLPDDKMKFLTSNSPHFALKIQKMQKGLGGQKPQLHHMKSLFSLRHAPRISVVAEEEIRHPV